MAIDLVKCDFSINSPLIEQCKEENEKRFSNVNSEVLMISRLVGDLNRDLVFKKWLCFSTLFRIRFDSPHKKKNQQKLSPWIKFNHRIFFWMNRLLFFQMVNGGYLEVIQIWTA